MRGGARRSVVVLLSMAGRCRLLQLGCLMVLCGRSGADTSCAVCARWEFEGGLHANQCDSCQPGEEPNARRDGCRPCSENSYSDDGGPCVPCPYGQVPNSDHSGCDSCPSGQYADEETFECTSCDAGSQPNDDATGCEGCFRGQVIEAYYAGIGEEVPDATVVAKGNLVSAGGGALCTPCVPGTEPNEQWSACDACPEGTHSEFGCACEECRAPGEAPTDDKTACELCEDGKYSQDGARCATCDPGSQVAPLRDGCDACSDEAVYAGGRRRLDEQGYLNNLVSLDGSVCEACEPGRVPNEYHTACVECPDRNMVSLYGANCTECRAGKYANEEQTECEVCEAGMYAAVRVTGSEPACRACTGRTYSNEGENSCLECDPGTYAVGNSLENVATEDISSNSSAVGNVRCLECDIGQYAGISDLICQYCPAGKQPDSLVGAATSCETCEDAAPGWHSPDGVTCVACYGSGSGEIAATPATRCHCPGLEWDSGTGSFEPQSHRFVDGSYDFHTMGNVQAFVVGSGSTTRVSSDINDGPCKGSDGGYLDGGSCCQACPAAPAGSAMSAMNCTDGSSPAINPGVWWREGASDVERRDSAMRHLFFCPNPEACLASGPGDQGCAPGYRGPLCAACASALLPPLGLHCLFTRAPFVLYRRLLS